MANIEKCGISLVWMEGKFPKDDHMAYKKKKEGNTNPSQTGGHGLMGRVGTQKNQ